MLARDLMTLSVIKLRHDATINEALALMARHDVGFLPILRDGRLCGTITDRDLLLRGMKDGTLALFDPVLPLASPQVHQARTTTSAEDLAQMMREHRLRRIPICDELGILVGVVSLIDLARRGAQALAAEILAAHGPEKPSRVRA